MSERKWTKGPWEVVEHSWSDTSVVGPDGTICTISIADEATEDNQPELERRSASRVRLIAAAPELYEALAELLQEAEAFSTAVPAYGNSEAIAKARAALSAAGGGV